MITGYPLFRGRDNADQLVQIMKIVGTPSDATMAQIKMNSVSDPGNIAQELLGSDRFSPKYNSRILFPNIRNSPSMLSCQKHRETVS